MTTPLVDSTVRAAMHYTEGTAVAAAGMVPNHIASLTRCVLRSMSLARSATAFTLFVAAGLALWLLAASSREVRVLSVTQPPAPSEPKANTPPPDRSEPAQPRPIPKAPGPEPLDPARTQIAATKPVAAPANPEPVTAKPEPEPKPSRPSLAAAVAKEPPTPVARPRVRPRTDEQQRGGRLFAKEWIAGDPESRGGDGLGPVYNDTACIACHGMGVARSLEKMGRTQGAINYYREIARDAAGTDVGREAAERVRALKITVSLETP